MPAQEHAHMHQLKALSREDLEQRVVELTETLAHERTVILALQHENSSLRGRLDAVSENVDADLQQQSRLHESMAPSTPKPAAIDCEGCNPRTESRLPDICGGEGDGAPSHEPHLTSAGPGPDCQQVLASHPHSQPSLTQSHPASTPDPLPFHQTPSAINQVKENNPHTKDATGPLLLTHPAASDIPITMENHPAAMLLSPPESPTAAVLREENWTSLHTQPSVATISQEQHGAHADGSDPVSFTEASFHSMDAAAAAEEGTVPDHVAGEDVSYIDVEAADLAAAVHVRPEEQVRGIQGFRVWGLNLNPGGSLHA